ncbi:hypothetical protein FBR02_11645 [Anaerolineae bacterium CFX9]|nr:hypothetical protein [Anaerolineae bacterium CFX9]
MSEKIYCFVDETGQHTQGKSFIVGLVLCDSDVEVARGILLEIERITDKGILKWAKSRHTARIAYIENISQHSYFAGKLFFRFTQSSREYFRLTAEAIVAAIQQYRQSHKVTIIVDGLENKRRRELVKLVRERGIRVDKVRGIKDESDPMIRLADALCGFLADSYSGWDKLRKIREEMIASGVLFQLT